MHFRHCAVNPRAFTQGLLPAKSAGLKERPPSGKFAVQSTQAYRVRIGDAEEPVCLRGAVIVGFSLLVSGGGSLEDLEACAQGRSVTALYVPHEGEYVPYILGAPAFVNEAFAALYAEGVPALTPLIAKSEGPPSADPASLSAGVIERIA